MLIYVLIGLWRRDIHVRETEQRSQADSVKGCDEFATLHRIFDTLALEQNNSQVAVQKWLEFQTKLRLFDARQPTCFADTIEQLQAAGFLARSFLDFSVSRERHRWRGCLTIFRTSRTNCYIVQRNWRAKDLLLQLFDRRLSFERILSAWCFST